MAAPAFPDRPEWLTENEWQLQLNRVRHRHRVDGATMPIGLISADEVSTRCALSPEEVWWEAWQIAVIQGGHRVAPPAKPMQSPEAPEAPEAVVYRTGAPGRPGSRHLIEEELRRRLEAGAVRETLAAEAKDLCEWLKREHPKAPPMGEAAIANAMREIWRKRSMK